MPSVYRFSPCGRKTIHKRRKVPCCRRLKQHLHTSSLKAMQARPGIRKENKMPTFEQAIEINATPAELFRLTQDYNHRLDWDPFLKEARLVGDAQAAGIGVRAWCVAK